MNKSFLLAIFLSIVPITASAATITLSPDSGTVNTGDILKLSVMLDTQGLPIDGVDLHYLHFDPSLFRVVDMDGTDSAKITPGSLMPLTVSNTVDAEHGTIAFSQVVAGGTTYMGSGVLATVLLKAIAPGISTVNIDHTPGKTTDSNVAAINGTDVLKSVSNGSYTIDSSGADNVMVTPRSGGKGSFFSSFYDILSYFLGRIASGFRNTL